MPVSDVEVKHAAPRREEPLDLLTEAREVGGIEIGSSVIPIQSQHPMQLAQRALTLSLIRGAVYRLKLSDDGRSVVGAPIEMFPTPNRYRDIALNPDGRTIYLATDPEGPSRDPSGAQRTLANPGSILEFTFSND